MDHCIAKTNTSAQQVACMHLLAKIIVKAKRVSNVHAVSGCKVSVHQLVSSEVLHSFGNLKAHVQHSFLRFTDLQVCIGVTSGAYVLPEG